MPELQIEDLVVEAGPACCDDLPAIYDDVADDRSIDLELIILDHPTLEDVARITAAASA